MKNNNVGLKFCSWPATAKNGKILAIKKGPRFEGGPFNLLTKQENYMIGYSKYSSFFRRNFYRFCPVAA